MDVDDCSEVRYSMRLDMNLDPPLPRCRKCYLMLGHTQFRSLTGTRSFSGQVRQLQSDGDALAGGTK